MSHPVTLDSTADLTLANAARIAFDGCGVAIGPAAKARMAQGRERFQTYLDGAAGGYVYGSTTAPGARAKVLLSAADAARQSQAAGNFILLEAGLGGEPLPERCVRLALFARLSNAFSGRGKLRPETAEAIAALLAAPPPVPLRTATCSGEVIPLGWLMAPIARLPLAVGEAMALFNGSPFATAMAADVALTLERRLKMAEAIFALSCEAAQCPRGHFDPRLAEHWPDPYYAQALKSLGRWLEGSQRLELSHQAPTSWRVLPNVLAGVAQAIHECSTAAAIGLAALKDNPTFLCQEDGTQAAVVSSAGYHDHRAGKAIDQANSIMLDTGVLAARQIARFLDGEALDLPALLARPGDLPGIEYTAWGLTEVLANARRAAEPTTLDMGVHDPAGNQSDITSLAFSAYAKHREAARAWDDCLASLAIIAILALDLRAAPLAPPIAAFCAPWLKSSRSAPHRTAACAAPLREIRDHLSYAADGMTSAEFAALFQR
jgi:histidine ammonia-lyase